MLCSGKAELLQQAVTLPNHVQRRVAEPNLPSTNCPGLENNTTTAKKRTALASKNWKTFKRTR
jgi:hypothetical protein